MNGQPHNSVSCQNLEHEFLLIQANCYSKQLHTLHGIQYFKSCLIFLSESLFFPVWNIETANAGEMQAEVVTAQYIQLINIYTNHKA